MIELLRRWTELEPGECRAVDYSEGVTYSIGDYAFWLNSFKEFEASCKATVIRGRPALAWLRDAIEQAIEARGWRYRLDYDFEDSYSAWVFDGRANDHRAIEGDTPAAALLSAYLEALEAGKGEG